MLRAHDRFAGFGRSRWALAAAFGAAACSRHASDNEGRPLRVAAASDLTLAFAELGASYEKATGQRVVFSFGSTGLLERQVVEGAPFDVFAAADVSFVDDAVDAGACDGETKRIYAVGRLAVVTAPGVAFGPIGISELADKRIARVAIANPGHAPYGRAARQAMQRAGVWSIVEPKVVYGENVHQALEFAESGNADAAIVAEALTMGRPAGAVPVPAELHDPIDQAVVVCSRGAAEARAAEGFCAYLTSPAGSALIHKYGFTAPGASMPGSKRSSTGP